jgi:hypothetical protein
MKPSQRSPQTRVRASHAVGGARLLPSGARVVAIFRRGYALWDRFDEAGISIARQNLQHAHEARFAGIGVLRVLLRVLPLGYVGWDMSFLDIRINSQLTLN